MLLAASAVVLSMFAVAPASASVADSAASGPKSVKRKCVTTGTASETFRLKADPSARTLSYRVSVKTRHCLVYTMVSKSVRGKTVSQPEVSSVEEELTVSHSGYLPERNGRAATDLLPGGGSGLVMTTAMVDAVTSFKRDDGKGFLFYTESARGEKPIYYGGTDDAWGALAEPGFSCSRGKCRPVKRSGVTKSSHAISVLDQSRVFLGTIVRVHASGSDVYQSKGSILYWDNGDPCGVEFPQCTSSVKPVTSFKSQRGSMDDWGKNATFLGIPASLRASDRCDCPVG